MQWLAVRKTVGETSVPEETSAKPTPVRAGTMMAPTFGCRPLSGKPLVVTAFAPPAKMVQAATAAAKKTLLISSPMRF